MERKAFLDMEAPPGYVAGIGRGATGFVTGGDSGGIKSQRLFEQLDGSDNEAVEGDETGLLAKQTHKDDEEADKVYEEIEKRLLKRRKPAPELIVTSENTMKDQFVDLKRDLASITTDDWANLPEAADLTKRNKRARMLEQLRQRYYATPDNIIASQSLNGTSLNVINDLERDLENDADSNEMLADILRNRSILSSLRKSEPFKASSWIASARLEEQARNFNTAKKLISEGCAKIPHNEDVWLESIKLHQNSTDGSKMAKIIATEALKYNSNSVKLWIKASECENSADIVSQRRILMKGLEFIPKSVELWEKLIELQQDKEDVKKMLTKVVELCQTEWKFWLSLINLSDYKEAKDLINRGRKIMKDNPQIWITAVKLEERNNSNISGDKLTKMLEKGIKQLNDNTELSKRPSKQDWLGEAKKAASEGYLMSCKAIVLNCLDLGVPVELSAKEKQAVYLNDAKKLSSEGANAAANFVYEFITTESPNDIDSWLSLFSELKKSQNMDFETIFSLYEKAISLNKEVPIFRLMYAKDKWILQNDVTAARSILQTALKELPDEEEVWFANLKFEVKNKNFARADKISKNMVASISSSSARVWLKYIHFQRFFNHVNKTEDYENTILEASDKAISLFPEAEKLYLQKAQILLEDVKQLEEAKEIYSTGVNKFPESSELWLGLAKLYKDNFKVLIRARSILDSAMVKLPDDPSLWAAKVDAEVSNKDLVAARQLCNKALKKFNSSPDIWLVYLSLISKLSQRKNAFLDALKATNNSPTILLHIGIFFWLDGKTTKAKSWFDRAVDIEKEDGDIWGWLNNFYSKHGTTEEMNQFMLEFNLHSDHINKGKVWISISKAVANLDKSPEELLNLVSNELKLE